MSRDKRDFAARWRAIGASILLGLALSACARGRSIVDVQPPASRATATSAAQPVPAEVKATPALATPAPTPTAEFRRTGVLANDIAGHWIGYADYSLYSSPTAAQQQALLNRCGKYYSIFKIDRSKFIVEAH